MSIILIYIPIPIDISNHSTRWNYFNGWMEFNIKHCSIYKRFPFFYLILCAINHTYPSIDVVGSKID